MTIPMFTNAEFHDAVLKSISVDWGSGSASLEIELDFPRRVKVLALNLTELHLRREMPWGKSVCILNIYMFDSGAGKLLDIEMQTGDMITLRAQAFEKHYHSDIDQDLPTS